MAAEVVHKEVELIIRLNDSASVLDAEMTAIRVALETASETRDTVIIHTYSLTFVNMLNNKKLDLITITRAIRDATLRLTRRPTMHCIPAYTGIPGNYNAVHAAKRDVQLDSTQTTINTITFREQTKMKEQMARHYNEQSTYNDASQQLRTTDNYTRLTTQGGN